MVTDSQSAEVIREKSVILNPITAYCVMGGHDKKLGKSFKNTSDSLFIELLGYGMILLSHKLMTEVGRHQRTDINDIFLLQIN